MMPSIIRTLKCVSKIKHCFGNLFICCSIMSPAVSVIFFGKTKMNLEIHWQYFLALSPELLPLIFWKIEEKEERHWVSSQKVTFLKGSFSFSLHSLYWILIYIACFLFFTPNCSLSSGFVIFFTFQIVLKILFLCY